MKFYKCPICGNIVAVLDEKKSTLKCCESEMEELVANKEEAATEKHIPIYNKEKDEINVTVGEIEHPMTEEHFIEFIACCTDKTISIIKLQPNQRPIATFKYIKGSKIYAYCNIHGLWVNEIK